MSDAARARVFARAVATINALDVEEPMQLPYHSRRRFMKLSAAAAGAAAGASPGLSRIGQRQHGHRYPSARNLDDCNVIWNSPSGDSFGSMPLGNGDVALNLWVEANGDVVFYVSKVDAFDSAHLLPKLGRVRVSFKPALDISTFRQTLTLQNAVIEISFRDASIRVWVDANAPVVRVEGQSAIKREVSIAFEPLRPVQAASMPLPDNGTAGIIFEDSSDRIAWCYRNQSSEWFAKFANQNTPSLVAKTTDPILHRTSGCVVSASGFRRFKQSELVSQRKVAAFDCHIQVFSSIAATPETWLEQAERPCRSDWVSHREYWRAFWDRSYIRVTSCGVKPVTLDQHRFMLSRGPSQAYAGHDTISVDQNAFQLSQRYALERFCQAIASRGAVPPPYNGSLFTMDMPAGVMGFDRPKSNAVSPDGRDWAVLSFMWQNTRHPYWSMIARGDYDTLVPGMQFVRQGLDFGADRTKKLFGFDGAFIMEASWWYNVGFFNFNSLPDHLKSHFLATVELPSIMADLFSHTGDIEFLNDVLLPCATEGLRFYFNRFSKRDSRGLLLMEGAGAVESYNNVTNPATELGGMKFLLDQLLTFPLDEARRREFAGWRKSLPDVPTRLVRGIELLAVGDVYDPGRTDCETPELYSVYPFRQAWLGTPDRLSCARQSFHLRNTSLDGTVDWQPVETGGWQAAPVQAAYLGLAREAARLTSINFNDRFLHWSGNIAKADDGTFVRGYADGPGFPVADPASGLPFPYRPRPRFPAFWECKMDGTPDNDHGANSANALQSMLLQSDGQKIYLLPAWPEDWDVSFRLRANENTIVDCIYEGGKVRSLTVSPKSRMNDIVDFTTEEARIGNMIEVACSDRNWLFGLMPMLDGLPIPGPTTAPWIKKYGESVTNVKGAPWPNCVFRGNVLYVHRGAPAPLIPAELISSEELSPRIRKLTFDRPIEPIARATAFANAQGYTSGGNEIDLGKPILVDRLEFNIENPGYRRGQAKDFELQAHQDDGSWITIHRGKIYGTIYAKPIGRVTAQRLRLSIDAKILDWAIF